MHNLPSPYSTYISAIQLNEHDQDSFQSAPKPQSFTIRKKLSAPQIQEIIFEGLSLRWPISFEENGSASLGHGVNAGLCAKPLPAKAHESNKIRDSECEIGSMLAHREIVLFQGQIRRNCRKGRLISKGMGNSSWPFCKDLLLRQFTKSYLNIAILNLFIPIFQLDWGLVRPVQA